MRKALLLIAHGSRRADANADLVWVADTFRQKTDEFVHIQPSYLELAEPSIEAGGAICVEAHGADVVIMLPYFLSPGRHVMEDMNSAQSNLKSQFPNVNFRLAGHLGRHEKLIEIAAERVDAALR